jgi:hypothetical protein
MNSMAKPLEGNAEYAGGEDVEGVDKGTFSAASV